MGSFWSSSSFSGLLRRAGQSGADVACYCKNRTSLYQTGKKADGFLLRARTWVLIQGWTEVCQARRTPGGLGDLAM